MRGILRQGIANYALQIMPFSGATRLPLRNQYSPSPRDGKLGQAHGLHISLTLGLLDATVLRRNPTTRPALPLLTTRAFLFTTFWEL